MIKVRVTEANNGHEVGEILTITGDSDGETRVLEGGYVHLAKAEAVVDRPSIGTIAVAVEPDLSSFRTSLAEHLRAIAAEIEAS